MQWRRRWWAPLTSWLRDLGQVLHNQGTVGAFVPPADLLIDDDGVIVYMDVPGMRVEDIQIEVRADADRAEKQAGATA